MSALALGCAACSSPPASRPADAVFREIQRHEATLAHRAADAEDCASQPECTAMSEVCAAADAICELAREIEDPDAAARCALAHRQCRLPEASAAPPSEGAAAQATPEAS